MTALIQALGDRTPGVRQQAEHALSELGERGVGELIAALGDKDEDIQFGAMSALARLGEPAVEPLVRALGDKKPQGYRPVPKSAAVLLGKLGDARAVAPLVRAMRFADKWVDKHAAYALADMGEFDLLLRALEDTDEELAALAVLALRKLGDPRAADFIVERCCGTADIGILLYSGFTLVDFGDARAVEPLMRLYEAEYMYRNAVAEDLARLRTAEVVEPLIHVLEEGRRDGSTNARPRCAVAAQALGRWRDARAVRPLIDVLADVDVASVEVVRALGLLGGAEAIEPLLEAMDCDDSEVRSAAAAALALRGDARGTQRLLQDLDDEDYSFHAAVSLAGLGDAHGEDALIRIVEKDRDERPFTDEPVIALARMGNKRGLDELLNVFPEIMDGGDGVDWQKFQAVQILGDSGDKRAVGPLLAVASNGWWKVRPAVFLALGRLGDPQGADLLMSALGSYREGEREAAAQALGQLRDARAVDPLIRALDDIDVEVQASAARALGALGDMRALEPLIRMLGEKRKWTCLAAIKSLGQLGNPAAIDPLTIISRTGDPDVSAQAAEVVKLLVARDPARLQARAAELPQDKQWDLLSLFEGGFVRVTGSGQTITEILARIENLVDREFRIVVSPGTYFRSAGSHQNMATRRECRFNLPASASESMVIAATCINAGLAVPNERDEFSGIARVPDDVARFLEAAKNAGPMVVQAGVWALTDGYTARQVQMHVVSRDRFGNTSHAVSNDDIEMARGILDGLGIRHSL
jgi:HEAT repeat protein